VEFELSQHTSGPQAYLDGELSFHADLALTDEIAECLLTVPALQLRIGLELFRLLYWQTFNDQVGCWDSSTERAAVAYEIQLRQLASGLDPTVLTRVSRTARRDVTVQFGGWS
jgi:hypothetical protein